jgi:hypothetical protein
MAYRCKKNTKHPLELPHSDVVSEVYQMICEAVLKIFRAWKVAPALAVGCTVVMKPSELTPLTALVRPSIRHHFSF